MRVYRVYAQNHDAVAFSGEGPRLHGGRWTSPGIAVEYTAGSLALAILEVMANSGRRLPAGYVYRTVDIPDDLRLERVSAEDLPARWFEFPAPLELRTAGDGWAQRGQSVGLIVPSAVVRIEENVVLNPGHADFSRLRIGNRRPLHADARLR